MADWNPYEGSYARLADKSIEDVADFTVERLSGKGDDPAYNTSRNQEIPSDFLVWAISASARDKNDIWRGIKQGAIRFTDISLNSGSKHFDGVRQTLNAIIDTFDDSVRDEVRSDLRNYWIPTQGSRSTVHEGNLFSLIESFANSTTPHVQSDEALVTFWQNLYAETSSPYARNALLLIGNISSQWWGMFNDRVKAEFDKYIEKIEVLREKAPLNVGILKGIEEITPEVIYVKLYSHMLSYFKGRITISNDELALRVKAIRGNTESETAMYELHTLERELV